MVKGVSRQVIVVKSPDPKLFEQAIFILRTDAEGITDEMLLKEVSERIQLILETYPYSWDIVKYALPFNLVNDTKDAISDTIEGVKKAVKNATK